MIRISNIIKSVFNRIRSLFTLFILKISYGNRVSFKTMPILGGKVFITVFPKGKIRIGKALSVRRSFEIRASGNVVIGDGCFFNNYCTLTALESIAIGDNCIFGERVSIYDHDHGFRNADQLIKEQPFTIKKVIIGNNVWIGSNVTILKGVHIGDNSVISANCVVFKDVPPNTILKSIIQKDYNEYR